MSSSIKLTNSSGKIVTITNPDTTSEDLGVITSTAIFDIENTTLNTDFAMSFGSIDCGNV